MQNSNGGIGRMFPDMNITNREVSCHFDPLPHLCFFLIVRITGVLRTQGCGGEQKQRGKDSANSEGFE